MYSYMFPPIILRLSQRHLVPLDFWLFYVRTEKLRVSESSSYGFNVVHLHQESCFNFILNFIMLNVVGLLRGNRVMKDLPSRMDLSHLVGVSSCYSGMGLITMRSDCYKMNWPLAFFVFCTHLPSAFHYPLSQQKSLIRSCGLDLELPASKIIIPVKLFCF